MEINEQFLVLHLMKQVYQTKNQILPHRLQVLLNKFPLDLNSKFLVKVTQAVLIFVDDPAEAQGDVNSQGLWEKLMQVQSANEFLKLFACHALKSLTEYCNNNLDAPFCFYSNFIAFIENKKRDRSFNEFYKELDQASIEIIVKHQEASNYELDDETSTDEEEIPTEADENSSEDETSNEDKSSTEDGSTDDDDFNWTEVEMFVQDVMNCILSYFKIPKAIRLEQEYKNILPYFSINVSEALRIILLNQNDVGREILGNFDSIYHYCCRQCENHFNFRDFFELCVCVVRRTTLESSPSIDALRKEWVFLMKLLLRARDKGKFTTLNAVDDFAIQLIADENSRLDQQRARRFQLRYMKRSQPSNEVIETVTVEPAVTDEVSGNDDRDCCICS